VILLPTPESVSSNLKIVTHDEHYIEQK